MPRRDSPLVEGGSSRFSGLGPERKVCPGMTDHRRTVSRLALAAGLFAACAVGGTSVLDAQEQSRWRIAPTPLIEIGQATGGDAYLFQSVQSAHFLPDGRVVVADAGQHVIRIFEPDGTIWAEFGGKGQGPREFKDIEGTWLTPDGRIAVWDAGNRRITTYRRDGTLRSSERVKIGGNKRLGRGNLEVFLGAFSDGDALLGLLRLGSRPGTQGVVPDPLVMGRFGLDGRLRKVVGELSGMRRLAGRPIPFSPVPLVAVSGDTIYEADAYGAKLTVRNGEGSRLGTIVLQRREMSADGVWSSLEAELRRRSSRLPIYKRFLRNLKRDRVPRNGQFPQLADLVVDDRGFLWVKLYEPPDDSIWLREKGALWPAPGGEWRIVRPDGRIVATVRMPPNVRPLEIRGDRILGLATTRLGVERIVVHRIEGRPSP